MSHIDDGLLHAYLDGALHAEDPAEAERVERHLAVCDDCRARLEAARRLHEEADILLEAAAPAQLDMPPFEVIAARAAATDAGANDSPGVPTRSLSRQRRFHVTRTLAWAASIVMALGMGWWAHELAFQPGGLPQAPANPRERAPAVSDAQETATPTPATDRTTQSLQAAPEREMEPAGQAAGTATFSRKAAGSTTASEPQAGAAAPRQAPGEPAPASEPSKAAAQQNAAAPPPNAAVQPSSAAEEGLSALAAKVRARAPETTAAAVSAAPSLATGAQPKAMVEAAPSVAADAAMRETDAVTTRIGPLTVEQARAWLGGPVYGVRGLEVVSVTASTARGSTRTVMVVQRLSATQTLGLHQLRPTNGNTFTLEPGATGVIRDGTLVYARAALPPDSLRVLLRRLVPLGN